MKHDGTRPRIAIGLDDDERRDLVQLAAERSVREGRSVPLAEAARDLIRRGIEAQKSEAA